MTVKQNILKVNSKKAVVLVMLFFAAISSFAYSHWDIRVDGRVTKDNERLGGAIVTLSKNFRKIQEVITPENGKFIFVLRPGVDYLIEVSKPGHVTKKIIFSTKNVPEELIAEGFPTFPIEISLFQEIQGLDVTILNYPVGRIAFSEIDNDFQIDRKYAKNIHNELTALYKELKALRKELAKIEREKQNVLADEHSAANSKLRDVAIKEVGEGIKLTTSIQLLKEKRERIRKEIYGIRYQILKVETYSENSVEIEVKSIYRNSKVVKYKKITQPWGHSYYFKDGASITKHIFLLETDTDLLLESQVFKF